MDIWNLGCLAYELATGNYLFPALVEPKDIWMLVNMTSMLGELPAEMRKDYKNLILDLLPFYYK